MPIAEAFGSYQDWYKGVEKLPKKTRDADYRAVQVSNMSICLWFSLLPRIPCRSSTLSFNVILKSTALIDLSLLTSFILVKFLFSPIFSDNN